jgi:FlaA1/EpsC-like NDP-sugar epimerase
MSWRDDIKGVHFLETPLGSNFLRYRTLFVVVSQIALILAAYFVAFVLRYGSFLDSYGITYFWLTAPWILAIKAAVFYYYDLYRGWWRYVGMNDLMDIFRASSVATLIFIFIVTFLFPPYPRSVFLIDWFVTIVFIGGIRFGIRAFREKLLGDPSGAVRNILIYGSHAIGVELLKEVRGNPALGMKVVGFIDDFAPKKGFKIHGVPILGGRDDIPKILATYEVNEIVITTPSLRPRELNELIGRFKETDIRFKIVPPMSDILNERVSIKQLRDVSVEDLLGRKSVNLDDELIRKSLSGKSVLITGAGGSIGAELVRQAATHDPETIVLFERNENALFMVEWEVKSRYPHIRAIPVIGDILDLESIRGAMEKYKPSIVYHAAAYKHVPMMEIHPGAAMKNNILGTHNVAEAAVAFGVERFVFISTDKAVRPGNTMGMTKRIGELICQSLSRRNTGVKFIAVRFGNVMGSAGSVIPLFQRQIVDGGPVTVTHPKAERYFMTIPEAVQLVMQASAMGQGGEIFVLEMGKPINILELAKNLIALSGLEPDGDIEIKFIGLRPGEKMSEELHHSYEKPAPTEHEKINVVPADPKGWPKKKNEKLAALIQLSGQRDIDAAMSLMHDLTESETDRVDADQKQPNVVPISRSQV